MKKIFFFAASCLTFAACSTESLVDDFGPTAKDGAIRFTMNQRNMTRAYTDMQKTGHYNFGVFAYKSTDLVTPVMPNYLVGYYDENNAYQKAGTTWGDGEGLEDGLSYWMYEGMGKDEYAGTYAGAEITDAYKSNNANQYLKFWDKSAPSTCFYAYAPYINGTGTATYVDGTAQSATGDDTRVLTIPDGSIKDGYDDPALAEYMWASKKVAAADYGHDVPLQFQRLNAKVNIKFWEEVNGWKVRILDLQQGKYEGVQAAASIKKDEDYTGNSHTYGPYGYCAGKYYIQNGVKLQFNANAEKTGMKQFEGTTANNATPLKFKSPTEVAIGNTRFTAAESPTTYYAIPKYSAADVLTDVNNDGTITFDEVKAVDKDLAVTGFTFHVSYELTAEDTGERITVSDATVHVPAEYCKWEENKHYTYIFKITKNSNGTTIDPNDPANPDVDPTDPEVPETQALYPIVFDNCTVVDWEEVEGEWNISDESELIYHDVQLFSDAAHTTSCYSLVKGDLYVNVTDKDKWDGHAIDYTKITVSGPDATHVTYDNAGKITVAEGATAGVYTVTYECVPPTGAHATHPATWTEKFYVGNAYTVDTDLDVIGTNGSAAAALTITATKDGSAVTPATSELYIEYPDNFTTDQKGKVKVNGMKIEVAKDATPGDYKLVYKVNQGYNVEVAKKIFTVKDFSFTLSKNVVFNKDGGNTITANQAADASHVYTVTGGFTVTGNSIAVPNNTTEGTYTVTYTVNSDDAKTVYTKDFEVRNTHAVAVAKNSISKSVGTSSTADYSTDVATIKTTVNGVATDADLSAKLSIVTLDASNVETATTAGDFKITYTSANEYKLEVKNGAAAGSYYVKFLNPVAGTDKAEYVQFVVTE